MLVPFNELKETAKRAFLNLGLSEDQAETCAQIHASSSADGVESHGMNRIPRFAEYVAKGWINIHGKPELVKAHGAAENYDGHLGIGITNALFCSERAMKLAEVHGIGLVALKNTTHWMRGGTYAWKMAEAGFIGISWINTESCMPMWGSDEKSVGNNPFCIAIYIAIFKVFFFVFIQHNYRTIYSFILKYLLIVKIYKHLQIIIFRNKFPNFFS